MTWFADVRFDRGSCSVVAVDLDGDDPPVRVSGSVADLAKVVTGLIPDGDELIIDAVGVGLPLAELLVKGGVRIIKLSPSYSGRAS